jgi:diguanylate cyclase (GGDEF)-like protein/PAS domain S-box-containing protein
VDRKAAADAERLELALAGAGLGLWDRHLPTGVGVVDARWSEMIGYAPGELETNSRIWQSMVHPDDLPLVLQALQRHFDGHEPMYHCEYRLRHKNGSWVWILARGKVTERDAQGAPVRIVGTHMDVTERKATEEALRRSEERLALVMRASNDGAWDWNMQTGETHYSPRWWEMLGYAVDELPADATLWQRLIHPDDRPRVMAVAAQALKDGRSHYEVEVRFVHKDGHHVPVLGRVYMLRDAQGKAVRVSGVNTDLTERRRFENSLRESEERFRSLTALSSDWYWEQDADFRFVRIHAGQEQLRGLGQQNLGRTRWEVGALNKNEADWAAHRAVLQAHQPFHHFEMQRTALDGGPLWVSISGMPIFDGQGTFQGYRGVGRDITAHKLAQEEIQRLAFHDALTGLPNRRLLVDRLQHALAATGRTQRHGALLFIDLDEFKALNDRCGHETGDMLLKHVANRLNGCVRAIDTVARLGGDEFVVVLEELDADVQRAAEHTTRIGEHILTQLNQPYQLGSQAHHCTPSIGAALFSGPGASVDALLRDADAAMYRAKAAGRNQLRLHGREQVFAPS